MLHKEGEEEKECGVERTWAGARVIVTRGGAAVKEIWWSQVAKQRRSGYVEG